MAVAEMGPVLLEAVTSAEFGEKPDAERTAALLSGGAGIRLDDLEYDSLSWMEFCISIELETGAELTPDLLEQFDTLADVANWIVSRQQS